MSGEGRPAAARTAHAGCPARHGATVPRGQKPLPGAPGARFTRMFPLLEHRDPGTAALEALAAHTVGPSAQSGSPNEDIPAGFTYLGQFIDHDITFDPTSRLDSDNDPHALVNFRTPRLDLDSLYGRGPADQPFLYDWDWTERPGVKLLVDCNPPGDYAAVDLPRNRQERALTGDPRNDENLILSQLHLLFIRFHNRVVECVLGDEPRLTREELLDKAQRLVRWHYQWIVVNDFLRRVVDEDLVDAILARGPSRWRGRPAIPVEFSGAAFRFGHSMVRKSYVLRRGVTAEIFPIAGGSPHDLTGFRRLPATHVIQWHRFFYDEFVADTGLNPSQRIDPLLDSPLGALPPEVSPDETSLALLNLRRGKALGLPAGSDVARALGVPRLTPQQFLRDSFARDAPACALEDLRAATPLWYYVLAEARALGKGGKRLGPVGGTIVAEVLIGLLEADPDSCLRRPRPWRPTLIPGKDDFTMVDLLAFVGDDDPCGTTRDGP